MNLPNYGKPRVAKICLIALLCCFFLQQIACLPPPLDIDCYACFDGGCGKDTGFVCREGFCLRESDPDPTRCKKKEEPEKESEKTEVPEEISSPEENLIKPEEMISEEDSGNKEEPTPELLAEKEVEQDPNKVVISSLEGTGSEIEINYGGVSEPSNPVKAKKRYTDTWILTGENLNLVDSIELVREDTGVKVLDFNIQQKDSKTMTIKFPSKYILAGYFFLVAYAANVEVARAQTLVVQGEGFDQATLDFLKALRTNLNPSTNNLEITTDTVTFKSSVTLKTDTLKVEPSTSGGKVTLDLSASATLKAGTKELDFTGDTITVKSANVAINSSTFEAKGTNGTSIKLADASYSVVLSAPQKGGTVVATFSVEGGDKNATTEILPAATFESLNVHVKNGDTSKSTVAANRLGNLIIGYNEAPSTIPMAYRTGSHNLVLGSANNYSGSASIVSGRNNNVLANHSSILSGGGQNAADSNTVEKAGAAIFGGRANKISSGAGDGSSICSSVGQTAGASTSFICCTQ